MSRTLRFAAYIPRATIQTAIATIIRFSVSDTKPERHVAAAADAGALELAPVDVDRLEHRDRADRCR